MKTVRFDEKKNRLLKKERGIGFEEIADAIKKGDSKITAVIDHPNKKKFPNQKIFIARIKKYIYAVPFVENENEIFLKTLYPSRKYKKIYEKKV
jgi:hypothetical protein